MSKLTNRKFRTLMNRIFFGSLLSGILMFQGTGYITSNLCGAATNENQTVSSTEGLTVSDPNVNVGLVGEDGATTVSTSGAITINGGATAVVGKLNENKTTTNAVAGVDLTLKENGKITIGSLDDDSTGYLILAGSGIKDLSTVSTESGANVILGSGGLLQIGTEDAAGVLNIVKESQLLNNGSQSKIDDDTTRTNGINISVNGQLNVGTEDAKTTGNAIDGDGRTVNNGKINIYNETGDDNQASFGVYSDAAGASLVANGKVFVNGGAGTDGLITINGTLEAEEWESLNSVTLASTSSVAVKKLMALGSVTDGASLTVSGGSATPSDPTVALGGIKLHSVSTTTDGKTTVTGGVLTTNQYSLVRIDGLTEKMLFDGTVDATNGKYDVWLGNNFAINGSLSMENQEDDGDPTTVGIRFNGDSTIGSSAVVSADKLILGGTSQTAGGTVSVTNSGEFIVTDELVLVNEDATGKIKFVNKFKPTAATSSAEAVTSWIEKLNLSDNMIFANGVSGSSNGAGIEIKTLNLDGKGLLETYADSSLTAGTISIDGDDDSIVLTTAGTSAIKVSDFQLKSGIAQLKSTGAGAGLQGVDSDSVLTIGEADQDASATAQLSILGTDATFSTGTINIEGQGQIIQEAGQTLTFKTTVNNKTQIASDSEKYSLSADKIVFGENGLYSGGQRISADSMTFQDKSTLRLNSNETLTLSENGDLYLEKGATMAIGFGSGDDENGSVLLSGNGVANLVEGSEITVANVSELATGSYTNRTVVESESLDNVFDSDLKSTAFYTLTKNEENSTDQKLVLDLNVQSEFAGLGATPNQKAVGANIDSFRANDDLSDGLRTLLDDMMEYKTAEEVRAAMDALSGVGYANAMSLAMDSPWQIPFDQMGFTNHHNNPRMMRPAANRNNGIYQNSYYRGQQAYGQEGQIYGTEQVYDSYPTDGGVYYEGNQQLSSLYQPGSLTPRSVWGSVYHTSFNAKSDDNSQKYGISRTGLSLGYDLLNASDSIVGLNFNYSLPYMHTHNQRVEMNNFQLGAYCGRQFYNGVQLKGFIGLGIQQYQSKRTVEIADTLNNYFKDSYDGNSVSASLQLSRTMQINQFALIRPLIQVDMQQVWTDGYSEDESLASALTYDDASWNRTFARAGLEGEFNADFFQFTSRALYGVQLGGDSAPTIDASFVGAPNSSTMSISGVDLGESFIDLGVGVLGYLDCERKWGISGNYDFVASDKSTSHTGVAGISHTF